MLMLILLGSVAQSVEQEKAVIPWISVQIRSAKVNIVPDVGSSRTI